MELADLVLGQLAYGPLPLVSQLHRPDRRADEPGYRMIDRFQQPPHEMVAPLVQDQLHDRPASRDVNDGERVDPGQPVLQLDPVAQPATQRPRYRTGHLGKVGLRHLERRVGQAVRQLTVVREEEKPFGLGVEPADVKQPLGALGDVVPTVGRPSGSLIVDSTPRGLFNAR